MMTKTENIHVVEDFLGLEDFELFLNFFNTEKIFNDTNITSRSMITPDHSYEIHEHCLKYVNIVTTIVSSAFGLDVCDFSGTAFRKWYPGEYQPPHSDCEAIIYEENDLMVCEPFYNFSSLFLEYAALTYLNDDYEGGEIYFPDHDVTIKPKANTLIFFPGTNRYMHGVKPVVSGSRLVVQNFLTTHKLRYIWETFVQGQEELNFTDYSQDDIMSNKRIFNRSNIPANSPYRIMRQDEQDTV